MIPVEEAQARVLEAAKPTGIELIMLADAHGRTLAEPIIARRTQPPADMSAMDGYALRAADTAAAPANLKVIGESPQAGLLLTQLVKARPFESSLAAKFRRVLILSCCRKMLIVTAILCASVKRQSLAAISVAPGWTSEAVRQPSLQAR